MPASLELSPLPHLWLIDLDGTIVKHNGHLETGDSLLPGVKKFWSQIPLSDHILILTARENKHYDVTVEFLRAEGIRYNQILFEMPKGERIVVNDQKPSGLYTAYAITLPRDQGLEHVEFSINQEL